MDNTQYLESVYLDSAKMSKLPKELRDELEVFASIPEQEYSEYKDELNNLVSNLKIALTEPTESVIEPQQNSAATLLNQQGIKPFKYKFTLPSGQVFSGKFNKKLNESEINSIADYLQFEPGFTTDVNIDANPEELAQYLAQSGASDTEIEKAFTMPRETIATLLDQESIGPLIAAKAGDALSGAGRTVAAVTGEIGDLITGNDEESFESRYGRINARPDQNFVSTMLEETARDPMLPAAMGIGGKILTAPKYVPGQAGLAGTRQIVENLLPKTKQLGYGLGTVAGTDIMNDYATGSNKIGLSDYILGGLGGLAMPETRSAIRSVIPEKVDVQAPYNTLVDALSHRAPNKHELFDFAKKTEYVPQIPKGAKEIGLDVINQSISKPMELSQFKFTKEMPSALTKQQLAEAKMQELLMQNNKAILDLKSTGADKLQMASKSSNILDFALTGANWPMRKIVQPVLNTPIRAINLLEKPRVGLHELVQRAKVDQFNMPTGRGLIEKSLVNLEPMKFTHGLGQGIEYIEDEYFPEPEVQITK